MEIAIYLHRGVFMETDENSNIEALNSKQYQSAEKENPKRFDLEDRSLIFAKRVNSYVKKLVKTIPNCEIGRQLVRSAGSIGANYIEANESLSKKDFLMRIKISRKEAKETRYWLYLSEPQGIDEEERGKLIIEVGELMKIFGSIVVKCS